MDYSAGAAISAGLIGTVVMTAMLNRVSSWRLAT